MVLEQPPTEEIMAAAMTREPASRTYNLLSAEERKEFYGTEEFKGSGLTEEEADDLIATYAGQGRTSAAARALLVDALLFGKAARRARKGKGKTHGNSATSAGHDSGQPQAAETFTAALEHAVIEELGDAAEPFRAWKLHSPGATTPKPVAFVRAEEAARTRRTLLGEKDTARDGSAQNSDSQIRQNFGTDGNLPAANDAVLEQTEIPSPELTERRNMRKSFHGGRQDAGTDGNFFPETGGTLERAEIPSRRMTERQNERKFAHSSRQDAGTTGNSFPGTGGNFPTSTDRSPKHAGIPFQRPAGCRNPRGFHSPNTAECRNAGKCRRRKKWWRTGSRP